MAKIKRYNFAHFLNTGTKLNPVWSRINKGVTELSINYAAEVTTEQYIGDKNASSGVENYAPTAGVSMVAFQEDPCFVLIDGIRKARATGEDAEVQLLNVNVYDSTTSGSLTYYTAEKQDCVVEITSAGGEGNMSIEATLHFNGDPTTGYATIVDGVPIFTENIPTSA